MHEARHGGIVIFAKRVVGFARKAKILAGDRNVRAPQRLVRVGLAQQARIVGRDADRQRSLVAGHQFVFIATETDDPGERPQVADAIAKLPAPVVPVGGGGVRVETAAECTGTFGERKWSGSLALLDGGWEQRRKQVGRLRIGRGTRRLRARGP